jgi:hypothetical protein
MKQSSNEAGEHGAMISLCGFEYQKSLPEGIMSRRKILRRHKTLFVL